MPKATKRVYNTYKKIHTSQIYIYRERTKEKREENMNLNRIFKRTFQTTSSVTNGRGQLYNSILDTIGNTPCVKVNTIGPSDVNIYCKAEFFNPAASVKDRLAISIIEEAEKNGTLKKGDTVIEATSGNTGVGLAMVCAAKGYPLVVVMADSFSIERRKLMRFLGAKVVLTPREYKGFGMIEKAQELAKENNWFLASQFETEANAKIHEETTAREIMADFKNQKLDYWVTGYGTGGTISGVAKVLRNESPHTKIVLTEPAEAALITSGKKQEKNDASAEFPNTPAASHPAWSPHLIQGWTPDFISHVLQNAIDKKYFDDLIPVGSEDGVDMARQLAAKEGIITGISGGSTFKVALDLAKNAEPGSNILCMLPDTAERYMSSPLFETIEEDMNSEENIIAKSTPGFHMDSVER